MEQKAKSKKIFLKKTILIIGVTVVLVLIVILANPIRSYMIAKEYYNDKNYIEALEHFYEIDDFFNSKSYIEKIVHSKSYFEQLSTLYEKKHISTINKQLEIWKQLLSENEEYINTLLIWDEYYPIELCIDLLSLAPDNTSAQRILSQLEEINFINKEYSLQKGYRDMISVEYNGCDNDYQPFKVNLSEIDIKLSFQGNSKCSGYNRSTNYFVLSETNDDIETELKHWANFDAQHPIEEEKVEYFRKLLNNGYYVARQEETSYPFEVIAFNKYVAITFYCNYSECGLTNVEPQSYNKVKNKNYTWIYITDLYH